MNKMEVNLTEGSVTKKLISFAVDGNNIKINTMEKFWIGN